MSSPPEVAASIRRRHDETQTRIIAGFAGPPGSGKSTVVQAIADVLGPDDCAVVPMDGFHLANNQLDGTDLAKRKGAIDTFDVHGYLHLLERLRRNEETVIYAPSYERRYEEAIAGAIAVPHDCPIILTEGNYLLSVEGAWAGVSHYLDMTWYVDTPVALRQERLVKRHMAFGKTAVAARAWASGPDEANSRYVEPGRARADWLLRLG